MDDQEEYYLCVGICLADPDSGYCLGCGRPPLATPDIVAEAPQSVVVLPAGRNDDPDSPQ